MRHVKEQEYVWRQEYYINTGEMILMGSVKYASYIIYEENTVLLGLGVHKHNMLRFVIIMHTVKMGKSLCILFPVCINMNNLTHWPLGDLNEIWDK